MLKLTRNRQFLSYNSLMIKKDKNKQSKINIIFSVLIALLAGYSAFLTYEINANRSASESVDQSLSESIFKLETKKVEE